MIDFTIHVYHPTFFFDWYFDFSMSWCFPWKNVMVFLNWKSTSHQCVTCFLYITISGYADSENNFFFYHKKNDFNFTDLVGNLISSNFQVIFVPVLSSHTTVLPILWFGGNDTLFRRNISQLITNQNIRYRPQSFRVFNFIVD